MFDRVAVIGDSDLVFPLKALGFRVFSPEAAEEARSILRSLKDEHIALCFLHERFLEPLTEERETLGKTFCPVVIGFSDYRQITDRMGEMMRDMAIKATGSDSLVARRGKDETR
ncbi:MAG: V-type ATP synthase subunit F [Candidatus Aminicenantes bacterium]|jgi:vacuolar-type H+-ATPase subunit F/Vma7